MIFGQKRFLVAITFAKIHCKILIMSRVIAINGILMFWGPKGVKFCAEFENAIENIIFVQAFII